MIPKKIHFIWVGKLKMPDIYIDFIKSWKNLYSEYNVNIWNDDLVDEYKLIPDNLKDAYYDINFAPAFKADILRYIIICKFGGLYFDVDFEPLKKLPDEFLNFDFIGGIQNNGEIAIGFFGGIANSILLKDTIENLNNSILKSKIDGYYNNSGLPRISGPTFFNKICENHIHNPRYFFFSKEYFYPYWFDEPRRYENFRKTSPISYAVHHWSKSWGI